MSSSFGSYDVAGFVKAPVYFYRSWWLANISFYDAGRPPLPNTGLFVHIVESWQAPPPPKTNRSITVYTNAPTVALSVNGARVGVAPVAPWGAAFFHGVVFSPGTLTATALDAHGAPLGSAEKASWGAASALVLAIDAPSAASGTGVAVLQDGQDVALIRATVVDAAGVIVAGAGGFNVSFSVTAGPALVWATSSGDPADHVTAHSPWRMTYHGLLRAVVRSTVRAAGSDARRALEALVNKEAGAGPASSTIAQGGSAPAASFTVTATCPGLVPASVVVPLSVAEEDGVLAVAARSVGAAYVGE